ncbi:ompA family protein [Asticcacaulis biprosthecium C19]|uniref:OmpA family protein n=2 Tax=Asticcacaulis biprosthecium TaxID=76891 RepID=F4QNQ4_9CAUL|nr:ompA family protein [Asticcacaulis biprosthecium C19]
MVAATGASAEQYPGWYGGVDLGYNSKGDYEAVSTGKMADGGAYMYDVATDEDWAGFARLGYRYNPNWRVEFEGGYRPGDVTSATAPFARDYPTIPGNTTVDTALCTVGVIRGAADPCGGPRGSFDQTTFMVNLYYDILPESSLHPFVGVGVGVDHVKAKLIGQMSTSPAGGVSDLSITGSDTVPAAQFLAGIAWALSDRLSLDVTYRYLAAGEATFDGIVAPLSAANMAGGGANGAGWEQPGEFSGKFNDQTVSVGLRWAFGAPAVVAAPPPPPPAPPMTPPAPPPPPPPAPPVQKYEDRTFIVYFEFDKSDLTADAQAVVSAAADYAKTGGAARVVVVGHADTSGSAAYNIRLSERRAKTVADALAGLGVDGSKLAVDWKGESQPAVATGDGVKEPLNRRSTIDIAF